jgi:mRNA interferase MazF
MKQGDIYIASLNPVIGHEQEKTRPCVIVQCNILNAFLNTIIVAPITSSVPDKNYPNTVFIKKNNFGLNKDSVIKLEQIRCVDKSRLIKKIGNLSNIEINKIKKSICSVFEINSFSENIY